MRLTARSCTTFENWSSSEADPTAAAATSADPAAFLDMQLQELKLSCLRPAAAAVAPPGLRVQDAMACDLSTCICDGVNLSSLRGHVYTTPESGGYIYSFSICEEIPDDQIPPSCKLQSEHTAVIKYKSDNTADCTEIGSLGPCDPDDCPSWVDDCSCGMTGSALPTGDGVEVTFNYWYGCEDSFTLTLTESDDPDAEPGPVTLDDAQECSYSAAWAGLERPANPIVGYNCRNILGNTDCFEVTDPSVQGDPEYDTEAQCKASCKEGPTPEPEPAPGPGPAPDPTPGRDAGAGESCSSWSQTEYLLWYGLFVSIFQFGWASVQTTHLALASEITAGCGEEAKVSLYSTRYGANITATLIVYGLAWILLKDASGSEVGPSDAPQFFLLAVFSGVIGAFLVGVFHVYTEEPEAEQGLDGGDTATTPLSFWAGEPTVWCMSLLYSASRVVVNISQTYLPLYLLTTLKLEKSSIATVPLVIYGAGLVASQLNEGLNLRLDRAKAYACGLCCALAALLLFLVIEPEPEGESTCSLSSSHMCIPWVYFGAVILGLGCSVLMPTAQSMVSEMIPEERKDSTATVWGCMSFVDKITNGVVIWVCQFFAPDCSGAAGDDEACSGCASPARHGRRLPAHARPPARSLTVVALLKTVLQVLPACRRVRPGGRGGRRAGRGRAAKEGARPAARAARAGAPVRRAAEPGWPAGRHGRRVKADCKTVNIPLNVLGNRSASGRLELCMLSIMACILLVLIFRADLVFQTVSHCSSAVGHRSSP